MRAWRLNIWLACLSLIIVSLPRQAAVARSSRAPGGAAPAIAGASALGVAGSGTGPAYLANPTGLYRAMSPFSSWVRRSSVGTIVAISPSAASPDDLVYATSDGTIFRSTDGGVSASPAAGAFPVASFARGTNAPATIYAVPANDQSAQIFVSADDGQTWSKEDIYAGSQQVESASTASIAVDPTNAQHVIAGVSVYHGGVVEESSDGGKHWHTLPDNGLPLAGVQTVAINPAQPSDLWVSWGLMGSGQIDHSTDGGRTWTTVTAGLPQAPSATAIGFDRLTHQVFLDVASVASHDSGKGRTSAVYASADGVHFTPFAAGARATGSMLVVLDRDGYLLTGDPTTPPVVAQIQANGAAGYQIVPTVATPAVLPPVETVFLGSEDGNLYALDATTGKSLWSFHTGGPASSPLVLGPTVYAGSNDGAIYAIDSHTGAQRWRFATGGQASAPAGANGTVYASSRAGMLYALDSGTGALRWKTRTGADPGDPVVAGGVVYLGVAHTVYAFDAAGGRQIWQTGLGAAPLLGNALGPVADNMLYLGTGWGDVYALDARTGRQRWHTAETGRAQVPGPALVGTATGSTVYVGAANRAIAALDTATGRHRWTFTAGDRVGSAPAQANGTVYAGAWDGKLYALDAQSGVRRWGFTAGQACYASPRVVDGTVYISFADGNTYALDTRTGSRRWLFHGGATYTTPAIGTPADSAAPAANARYFAGTGHNLGGDFLAFWQRYGGLTTLGYPVSEPFTEQGVPLQYTERAELQVTGGQVSLVPLGRLLTANRSFAHVPPFASTATRRYFTTGHTLSGRFLRYWQSHQGSVLLGSPIAEPTVEGNGDGSGRRYLVQWFENGRLEYHPELAGTRYEVEPGLVGLQALQQRGW